MTSSDIQAMAAACGITETDPVKILNTYVMTIAYGTSGAVVHLSTDFDYKTQKPISKMYWTKQIINNRYIEIVPMDHQVHQKWYVTEFIDLEYVTHIWFFDQFKHIPRVEYEQAIKDELNNVTKPKTGPMNYTQIIRNMSFPSKLDPSDPEST